jgi:hypothetical protein
LLIYPYYIIDELVLGNRFSDREIIPYHVKLSLEGLPQHAWYREVAEKVLCDEAVIRHVEQDTETRTDQRIYLCWAVSKDPSRIPQVLFLSLLEHDADLKRSVQVHLAKPTRWKTSCSTTTPVRN